MGAGRPTKLDDAMQQKARDYLAMHKNGENNPEEELIPRAVGLALYLGVSKAITYVWKDENDEFLDTFSAIQSLQERKLLSQGLSGGFNAAITKLALANHGYREKTATDITSGDKPIKNEWHLHPTDGKS